jgi:hypothetical protein
MVYPARNQPVEPAKVWRQVWRMNSPVDGKEIGLYEAHTVEGSKHFTEYLHWSADRPPFLPGTVFVSAGHASLPRPSLSSPSLHPMSRVRSSVGSSWCS